MNLNYRAEQSPEGNLRLSRSSLSENCSSPNDDYRPGFDSVDTDNENADGRPSFQTSNENAFYNKNSEHSEMIDSGPYSEKSKRMMSNMGFKPGKGLGKFEHGRVEPIEASTQKGKRGLGFQASAVGEAPKDFKWSPDTAPPPTAAEEVVSV